MKKIKNAIILLTVITITVSIFAFSNQVKNGIVQGLIMCANIIIPSLFPFAVISIFLTNSGLIFFLSKPLNKISNCIFKMNGYEFCIFILSLIGGYPIGATLLNQAVENKRISDNRSKLLINFCVNAGPAFIVLAVGDGIYHSKTIGLLLLCSHILASLILAIILCKKDHQISHSYPNQSVSDAFIDAVHIGTISIFKICSYVILFSAFISLINQIKNTFFINITASLLEVTNGIFIMHKNLYAVCFLLGFGGFSIHMQVYSIFKSTRPKYIYFLFWRIIHGVLSCAILKGLLLFFPQYISTLTNHVSFNFKTSAVSIWFSLALILMSICLLFSAKIGGKCQEDVLK